MAAIVIDYGTSNSEVVYLDGQQHHLAKLDPSLEAANKIRSSVFIYYKDKLLTPPIPMIEAKIA